MAHADPIRRDEPFDSFRWTTRAEDAVLRASGYRGVETMGEFADLAASNWADLFRMTNIGRVTRTELQRMAKRVVVRREGDA